MDNQGYDSPVALEQPPVTQPVSIDTGLAGDPAPSSTVAQNRAEKTNLGLKDVLGMQTGELYSRYMAGEEQSIRQQAASKIDSNKAQKRYQDIIDYTSKNGGTLTIDDMVNLQQGKATDPRSVVETAYSNQYVNKIYDSAFNIQDTNLDTAVKDTPGQVTKDIALGKEVMSNMQYAQKRTEDIQDVVSNQGWIPWAVDQAKSLVPFYDDVKMRGWMEKTSAFEGWLRGNNLYAQTRELLRLPHEQFVDKYEEIMTKLQNDNPSLALQYSNAVVGMSTSEQFLTNAFNVLDLTVVPQAFKDSVVAINGVRKGIADGIRSSATIRPEVGSAAEGFGDTAKAAVQKEATNLVQDIDGTYRPSATGTNVTVINDPIQRTKEALPTHFQLDKEAIKNNDGPLSRELRNRLVEQQDYASKAIVDTVMETSKTQRIALDQAAEIEIQKLYNSIKNSYPGLKNAIADFGDPIYNPGTNTHIIPVKVFDWTGEQFASEAAARKFARQEGILEYDIAGKPGQMHYLPEAAVKRPWETESRFGEAKMVDGEFRYFTDDGIEIQTSRTPKPGHIPVEVKGENDFTFHPTVQTEDDLAKAVVGQQGLGYHLVMYKELNETQSVVKDLMMRLDSTKSSASQGGVEAWMKSIFGYVRSSDNTLSPFEIQQRKTATYSISRYQKLLQDEMKYVEDVARGRVRIDPVTGQDINPIVSKLASLSPVSKIRTAGIHVPTVNTTTGWGSKELKTGRYDDFKRVLAMSQTTIDKGTGKPGYFFKNDSELYGAYLENFRRPPTFTETQGYFAFVRNYENDRVLRSLRVYTNKARVGVEQHAFSYIDPNGNKLDSPFVEGVVRKRFPGGSDVVAVIHNGKDPEIVLADRVGSRAKDLDKDVQAGKTKVIEIFDPELNPLKELPGVGNKYVRYVVVDNLQTKGLDFQQVNRLGGVHFEYDYSHYIKEANMSHLDINGTKLDQYHGDRTFMPVGSEAQGKQIVKVLNAVKQELRQGNNLEAKRIFEKGLPGADGPAMPWKDWYARTQDRIVDGKTVPATIDIFEDYHVVASGRSILDKGKDITSRYTRTDPNGNEYTSFKDKTKSGSLARQSQVAFTQERDSDTLMTLRIEGTKYNPIYKHEPAKFLDPIASMTRALNRITASSFMEDYKITAIEGWLREAEGILKASKSEIRSAPYSVFHQASDKSAFVPDASPVQVRNLLSNRFKTLQFVGTPSKYDVVMHEAAQNIADWSFDKMGPKGAALVPSWLIGHSKDPVAVMRSMAYHFKLGLFAVPQVLTQSQGYLTIASVAPRSAAAGTYATLLHQWSRVNGDVAYHRLLDSYAQKLNLPGLHSWKPGEFSDAMKELDRRGFANVGREYSTLDTQLKSNFIKSEMGGLLDLGQIFFKETDGNVRIGAWYTATKEYMAESGKSVLTRSDWDKVLDRADDLSGNMSRASSSMMQDGVLSLTGQFLTYQMHLAEFFWGKRMGATTTERNLARLRMFGMYSLMFGIPGAVGITGFPANEYIRKVAFDNGYVVGDDWVTSTFMEGPLSVFTAWITGGGDTRKGNYYNFNNKLGAGGFTQLKDLWSDGKWWHFLGGAASSIMANNLKNADGFTRGMASMLTGREEDKQFKMTSDDVADLFKEITSFNQAWKLSVAIKTGKWYSKNEAYQSDVSKMNAIFMAVTGLNMQDSDDSFVYGNMSKDETEKQKQGLTFFIREYRRAIQAIDDNNPEMYKTKMSRAFGYLELTDYPVSKYDQALALASKGYETQIDRVREKFMTTDVPQGKEQQRNETYTRFRKLQEERR